MLERTVLLLVIRRQFADAILRGEKRFDLRIDDIDPSVRYAIMYDTESQSLVGGFEISELIRKPVRQLWERVREQAAPRDRFDRYFDGFLRGTAIGVGEVEEYHPPVTLGEVRAIAPDLRIPVSYAYLSHTDALVATIADRAPLLANLLLLPKQSRLAEFGGHDIRIVRADARDEQAFRSLATSVIGERYDEIDASFAGAIWETHVRGKDERGFYTTGKTVYRLEDVPSSELIGFVVVTEKRGGSIKYGPTILLPEWQKRGIAPRARRLLDADYARRGARKSYSTIPASNFPALKYLLAAGYTIEAHLRRQYSTDHDEFVLGRLLRRGRYAPLPPMLRTTPLSYDLSDAPPPADEFHAFLVQHLALTCDNIDHEFTGGILAGTQRFNGLNYSEKAKLVFSLRVEGRLEAIAVATPKRGGAMKIAPFVTSAKGEAAARFLRFVQGKCREKVRPRKFYALLPAEDVELISVFREAGYDVEGYLREPYREGVDYVVVGNLVAEARP